MTNTLLEAFDLPAFDRIKPADVGPAVDKLLADNRLQIDELLAKNKSYTWETLVSPMEVLSERFSRSWSPVQHLHSVADNDELRAVYNDCLPKIAAYSADLGQNEALYQAYRSVAESAEFQKLNSAQRKIVENALRDFRLSGVALEKAKKDRFKEIKQTLSQLQAKFEENLLDATHAWTKQVEDENLLRGLPPIALALARQTAQRLKQEGWIFTLEFPSYIPVMMHAENRELRHELYHAYVTRASDQGPNAGQWNNQPLMEQILALRHEMANLLGFANFAEYSLATKMAKQPQRVLEFLSDLAARSKSVADHEYHELEQFAREQHGLDKLEAWDVGYYSELLRREKYAISQEDLRPFFPVPRVLQGLFGVVQRLYGLRITQRNSVAVWHPDVQFFEIRDEQGSLRGSFYLDLYARQHKRGGAWMDECLVRKQDGARLQNPVAYLTCNFTPAVGNDPALLTHSEVITLFHEFGHGLHHMLTLVDHPSVAGINGVQWDAVELPSQFMENWCWERQALDLLGAHYQTGERIDDALFQRMLAAKNFQAGMQMVRQLEFALFDFRLHLEYDPSRSAHIQETLDEVRRLVAVVHPPAFNRFQHGFSHIFAGGYAAGYYSYKWAEVLSADAYSKFEEQGIFNRETGQEFLHAVLEQGGTRDAMDLFIEFRGREPSIEPLLRHCGLAA
jgi:oligopeptidase A